MNTKKRLVVNTAAALIILAVAILAAISYSRPKLTPNGVELPSISSLKFVDAVVDLESSQIKLAVEIPDNATSEGITKDILEIYRWGRSHFRPIKCGPEYDPTMCKYGVVMIFLLTKQEIPTSTGEVVDGYAVIGAMGLDQVQIDKLNGLTAPTSVSELAEFHQKVAQETEGTGGFIGFNETPPIFTGLSR